ncbi:sensor domain-containing protein [Kineococcus radiotolerans]|uniref:PknH-like extracellular domain-containing protein n=1 Tax=Kineococcus radiotolerans (strain ATCC BAA-149 / DSM 14245 / SRS30216) TaxID=266940 RepID=A6WAH3_KINRD|nr:sensor domain-containing protein [Kineococcus radiotolerans]ABS03812.1 hypothetical protein Krad_2332 [Kineococcus radiotolerans SRS30216 = ATCC BAA-149]
MPGSTETDGDDPLVRALRRHDLSDHPLGTEELLTGARRRAGRIRTRRRATLAAFALVVAVPTGIGILGDGFGASPDPTVIAGPAPNGRPQAQPVAATDMLDDETATAVLPGATRDSGTVEEFGADVNAGLCVDEVFAAATLLGGRSVTWAVPGDDARQVVSQTVRRFASDGAEDYVQVARDQIAACEAGSLPDLETTAWTMVGDGSTGPDVVTAYAKVQDMEGGSLWRVRAVLENDGIVVDVSADLVRTDPDVLSSTAAGLADAGLKKLTGPQ